MAKTIRSPQDLFRPQMGTLIRVFGAWWAGLRLTLGHFGIALFICGIGALLTAPIDAWVHGSVVGSTPHQEDLIKVMLAWSGVALLAEIFYGPIVAAVAIYVMHSHAHGRKPSLYKAVNFAIARYKRMFLPHLGAQLSIQLGMLVVIPGIYFMTMYAFVDPVAALEDEKWAMARSKKLTRGRRKTILWVALPLIVVAMFRMLVDLWALEQGLSMFVLDYMVFMMLQYALYIGFTWLYLERTTKRKLA